MSNTNKEKGHVLIDGSRIIIESLAESGADVFTGYPITPVNLLYAFAKQRFPLFLAAPDEITSLQWAAGFATTGKIPVSATSFPGFALMVESINMAHMMELPMVIIFAQRLGPSTGSATTGAQGDIQLLNGCISGGYPIPVFCPSNLNDCWTLAAESVRTAINLRTPVVLLTSKEMVMTTRSFDLDALPALEKIKHAPVSKSSTYQPYQADNNFVPPFIPVGNNDHQVRLNASTHDNSGFIKKATPEAMANTTRLKDKIEKRVDEYTHFDLDEDPTNDLLLISYGITSAPAHDAIKICREKNIKVTHLVVKTIFPVPPPIFDIIGKYKQVVVVEENINGSYKEILFGKASATSVHAVNKIGHLISPLEIVNKIEACQ